MEGNDLFARNGKKVIHLFFVQEEIEKLRSTLKEAMTGTSLENLRNFKSIQILSPLFQKSLFN